MIRQFLLFIVATVITAGAACIDGSAAFAAGAGRLALVLFLFVPVLSTGAELLKGPPPI